MTPRSLLLITTLLLLACGTEPAPVATADSAPATFYLHQERDRFAARASAPAYAANDAAAPRAYAEVALTEVPDLPAPTLPATSSNMIIRRATASIEVDSLKLAVAQVKELAARLGGYVGSSGIITGKNQLRQATIEVKVPAARFDEIHGRISD